ncbi:hypothetical protein V6N12_058470 [Hibiscus sabdariffa]|uniref:DUF4283 domain-containing protein n=1 Tax=Hibiscus sabdariffa TaxID=183260 RepID=A0ABR2ESQ2_9ROSI
MDEDIGINTSKQGSYKDTLLGDQSKKLDDEEIFDDEDINLMEGDVIMSIVDGLISIDFSDRNKLYENWKPSQPFKLMDIEDDYFLVTLRTHDDFLHVLVDGPWKIFGHYLTIKPWAVDFTQSQSYSSRIVP